MAGKGLLMVHTGHGKGKTTAALGLAFRALGHGLPVCVIQFIKGNWKYGELKSAVMFRELLEIHVVGQGFTWESTDPAKDKSAASDGWEFAQSVIRTGKHHLVVLDEFTYALNLGLLNEEEALEALKDRPEKMHILVTGRDAPKRLLDIADLITEMRAIRHPYTLGVKAQKGIEW